MVINGYMNNFGFLKIGFYFGFFLKYGIKKKKKREKSVKRMGKNYLFFLFKIF